MIRTRGEKAFAVFNYIFLSLLTLLFLYPLWEVIKLSFCTPGQASSLEFFFWPKEPTLMGYKFVMGNENIWNGYLNTVIRIVLGMSIQLILTVFTAYALSKKELPHRSFWSLFIAFTMFFHGGTIPNYLLINNMNLDNTIWALVLPGAINTFSMLIVRNNFMSIPPSLEESAKIDGAGILTILFKIILPLSMPILATITLWGIVWHWGAWFDCLIYIRDADKYVLQSILRKIIIDAAPQFNESELAGTIEIKPSAEVTKCATIVVSTLPILLIYPFIQKYFVKGVMVGSVKG